MPVTYTNSLAPRGFPGCRKTFVWTDDPAEDADFVGFVREVIDGNAMNPPDLRIRNITLDRSGSPEFRWESWEQDWSDDSGTWVQTGTSSLPIGAAGSYWRMDQSASSLSIAPFDMAGYWECDAYGRPYNLADLQAPGMDPRLGQIQAHAAAIARDSEGLLA